MFTRSATSQWQYVKLKYILPWTRAAEAARPRHVLFPSSFDWQPKASTCCRILSLREHTDHSTHLMQLFFPTIPKRHWMHHFMQSPKTNIPAYTDHPQEDKRNPWFEPVINHRDAKASHSNPCRYLNQIQKYITTPVSYVIIFELADFWSLTNILKMSLFRLNPTVLSKSLKKSEQNLLGDLTPSSF